MDVNLISANEAYGGIMSFEDGVADSFLGVENEYSDGPRSRWGMIELWLGVSVYFVIRSVWLNATHCFVDKKKQHVVYLFQYIA